MIALDPIVFRELPMIEQIIRNETWLEGERRGCFVRRDDRAVRENVCQVVLRIGKELRESTKQAFLDNPATILPFPEDFHPDAA